MSSGKKGLTFAGAAAMAAIAAEGVSVLPAAAYNGTAAANYANQYAVTGNPAYQSWSPDDCTGFVSQALAIGGQPNLYGNGDYSNLSNWWTLPLANIAQIVAYGRSASYTATVAGDLKNFLNDGNGWGTSKGSFSYNNGQNTAPSFTPGGEVTGDVLFYSWHSNSTINHMAMQVGITTDAYGYYGNVVDEHTSNRKDIFWTLKDAPENTNWMTTTVYFEHVNV